MITYDEILHICNIARKGNLDNDKTIMKIKDEDAILLVTDNVFLSLKKYQEKKHAHDLEQLHYYLKNTISHLERGVRGLKTQIKNKKHFEARFAYKCKRLTAQIKKIKPLISKEPSEKLQKVFIKEGKALQKTFLSIIKVYEKNNYGYSAAHARFRDAEYYCCHCMCYMTTFGKKGITPDFVEKDIRLLLSADDYLGLYLSKANLFVVTTEIICRDGEYWYNFGEFLIGIDLQSLSDARGYGHIFWACPINIINFNGHPHPHINENFRLCLGGASGIIASRFRDGIIGEAYTAISQILKSGQGGYRYIDNWHYHRESRK